MTLHKLELITLQKGSTIVCISYLSFFMLKQKINVGLTIPFLFSRVCFEWYNQVLCFGLHDINQIITFGFWIEDDLSNCAKEILKRETHRRSLVSNIFSPVGNLSLHRMQLEKLCTRCTKTRTKPSLSFGKVTIPWDRVFWWH